MVTLTKKAYMLLTFVISLLLTLPVFPSCSSSPPVSAEAVIRAMTGAEKGLPSGRILSRMSDSEADKLTDALISALYTPSCSEWFYPSPKNDGSSPDSNRNESTSAVINDASIFISTVQHPCEFAVFRCSDTSSATAVAKQCLARLEHIRGAWRGCDEEIYVGRAKVVIISNFVILAVSKDPDTAIQAAERLIR